jgi:hypothetical protein
LGAQSMDTSDEGADQQVGSSWSLTLEGPGAVDPLVSSEVSDPAGIRSLAADRDEVDNRDLVVQRGSAAVASKVQT